MSSASPPFSWTSASRTHPGRVRTVNEDACLDQSELGLWAVADGLGGHALGEFASRLTVRRLMDLPAGEDLAHGSSGLDQRVTVALDRLREINWQLRAEAHRRAVPLIGTTIAALVASGSVCSCLWAGDSRVYLYRGRRLRQLTRDHSHLESVRSRHVAKSDDTIERPRANLITRALGAEDTLTVDRINVELLDGDIFLLCTDGLSNEVSELSMAQALLPGICTQACATLVGMALEKEARDNITAVVVRAQDLRSPNRTLLRPR